jgi:iron complex outermembrane recepter protein
MRRTSWLAVVLLLLAGSRDGFGGQDVRPAAALVGIVTATDDARLPGVTISITNVASGETTAVVTGDGGSYRSPALATGVYRLEAQLAGFQPQVLSDVVLRAGETREVSLTLAVATVVETLTVIGSAVTDGIEQSGIAGSGAVDIGEALARLPGLARIRKGAIGNDVVLHGHQAKNLTVLVDGLRMYGACPNSMDPSVFHADFAEVDRLEAAKGPFDVRNYGSLGGVVNIVTRKPEPGGHAILQQIIGSAGSLNSSAVGSVRGAELSLLAGFSYRQSGAYRDGAGRLFTEGANYRPDSRDARAFAGSTAWARVFAAAPSAGRLQLSYTRQRTGRTLYPYLLMDATSDDADRARATYERAPTDRRITSVAAEAFFSRVDHTMNDVLRVSSAGATRPYSMQSDAGTRTFGGKIQVALGGATVGVDAFRRRWNVATLMGPRYTVQSAIPDVAVDVAGAYAEIKHALTTRTRMTAGGRLDWSRSVADALLADTNLSQAYYGTRSTAASDVTGSGSLRIVHQLAEGLEIGGGIGRTARVADAQERYYAARRMGTDWVGNPTLRPVHNVGVNASADYHRGRVTASASMYHERLRNFITVVDRRKIEDVVGVMNTVARSFAGVDATMTSGEASVNYVLTPTLFASAQAAYTRASKHRSGADGTSPLSEIPPATLRAVLRHDRPRFFMEGEVQVAAPQNRVDVSLLEQPTAGYATVALRGGVQLKRARLNLGVTNLFDQLYTEHLSYQRDPFRSGVRVREPGRTLTIVISWRY